MAWPKLGDDTQDKYFSALIMPLLKQLLDIAGSVQDAQGIVFRAFMSHSLAHRSQSVTDAECIFSDPVLAMLPYTRAIVREEIKNEQSPYDFMIRLDEAGISTRAIAQMRRDRPGIYHCANVVLRERNDEKAMCRRLLGDAIKLFGWHAPLAPDKIGTIGYMLEPTAVVSLLARRAMVSYLQPPDSQIDLAEKENDDREALQMELCDMRDREGTAYYEKKEAELRNVRRKFDRARKRCALGAVSLQSTKENCIGMTVHNQVLAMLDEITVWLKIGFDGRVLLRQLTGNVNSNQFAAMIAVVNDALKVQSVDNTFGY
jgi:hypothetical protein